MIDVPSILAAGMVNPAFFVAGIFLAAIPIIIHILNRRRFRTVNWAAMEFLLRAMRKNRRRLRFEQWLLLAVRCFVLGLLGLALARPLGCNQATLAHLAGQRTGLHVLIIDNSYSMAYEADRPDAKANFDQAKILAKGVIDRLSAGGESVAIITAARPATAIIAKPAYDLQAAKESIDRIEQSYGGTDLAGALHKALDLGREESRQPNKALYLFSDATRGGWDQSNPTDLADTGREVAKLYRVTHYNLSKPNQWNEAVVDLKPA